MIRRQPSGRLATASTLSPANPQPPNPVVEDPAAPSSKSLPYGIVHADAFDTQKKRIKQFDPKKIKKLHGQYQLEEMEMLNEKTGSRTVIKFDLNAQ